MMAMDLIAWIRAADWSDIIADVTLACIAVLIACLLWEMRRGHAQSRKQRRDDENSRWQDQ